MTDRDNPHRRSMPPNQGGFVVDRGAEEVTQRPSVEGTYRPAVTHQPEPDGNHANRDGHSGEQRRPQMPGGVLPTGDGRTAVQIPQPANDPRFLPSPNAHPASSREAMQSSPVDQSLPAKRSWRWLKRSVITVAVLCGAIVIAVAALQIRLGKGPIEVPQLVGPIERGLSNELGDTQVTVGSVALFRAKRTGRLEFRLSNLQLFDSNGAPAVRVPTAAIDISRNALLLGSVAPKRIELIGPRLEMSYEEEAGLALRFAGFQSGQAGPGLANGLGVEIPAMTGAEASTGIPDRRRTGVSLVEVLQDTFKAARDRKAATSFLKSIGVRDAVIVLKTPESRTTWTAPNLALELWHQSSRSLIRGNGTLTGGAAPWAFAFEIDDTPARGAFQVRTLFKDLIPGEFGRAIPALSDVGSLETPLSGQADFQLSETGAIAAASADIVIGAGYMGPGGDAKRVASQDINGVGATEDESADGRVLLDEGHVKLSYDGEHQTVRIDKVDLLTGKGRIVLAGRMNRATENTETATANWLFDLNGKMRFATATNAQAPLSDISGVGVLDAATGAVRLDRFNIAWPEGQIAGRGQFSHSGGLSLAGQLGEMSKAGLLQAWPPFLAVDARDWLERNISLEQVTGGQFSVSLPKDFRKRLRDGGDIPAEAVSFDVTASGMEINYVDGAPPVRLRRATASIRGRTLRVKAPEGVTQLPSGAKLKLTQSDLIVRDLRPDKPETQMFMKVSGSAAALVEFLEHKEMGYLDPGQVPGDIKGKAEGIIRLQFPMHPGLKDKDVKLNGKLRLTGGGTKKAFNNFKIAGAAVDFDLTEKAVEASGDILVNGVPAKVRWLRLLEGGDDKQPPLRISAKLDASDRKQVGLNVNHFLTGTIATDVAIMPQGGKPPLISVQTDLTQAEIALDYLGWSKPAGRSAISQFDVVVKQDGLAELQNFKVVGDDVAVDGTLELGADNRVRRFSLPEFSIDVITRMAVSGALDDNNVWDIKVRASTFDARPIFRNLFSPKRFTEHAAPENVRRDGMIIRAFIKNMVGFSDASVTDMQIVFQRKDGKVVGLEANGALDSGAPIAVSLKPDKRKRRVLFAETKDAGAAFRLIGFYKNIRRGDAKLQVNLDEPGLADVSGVLWTRNFVMLGDPIVTEVLDSSGRRDDGNRVTGIRTKKDARGQRRTVIEFDQLRFNFSVGEGQFLLHKSYVNGPALGATLNGKVDFERRRVTLGGTYVPLYGLNSALGSVPILGELFVGRLGEGVLGITFGIQGRLDRPKVLVNPVSLVAPGIFRQIFEISPQRQKITRRRPSTATPGKRKVSPPANSSWPIEGRN